MDLSFVQCGYAEAYDYCQLMIMKLNSKHIIAKKYSLPGYEAEDIERTENIETLVKSVDKRLKLFFDIEYKETSFMADYLYEMKTKHKIE